MLGVDVEAEPDLERDEHALAAVAELDAVVPVGGEPAGQAVAAGALEVELQRPAQVAEHRRLALVGVGQHLGVEADVAGLGHVGRARR